MAELIELNLAAGTVNVDPDLVASVSNDGGANTVVYMVSGHTHTVVDAYSDVVAAINEGKLVGNTRTHKMQMMNTRLA